RLPGDAAGLVRTGGHVCQRAGRPPPRRRVPCRGVARASRSLAVTPGRRATVDRLIALGLLFGSIAYVDLLPRTLGGSDEGIYLYEAKRLLGGEVFYRDIFDLITPGAHYLMAGAFALFGASIDTARRADAIVHGLIVLTTYVTARMLGVRGTLAAAAGL